MGIQSLRNDSGSAQLMTDAGAQWARVTLVWSQVEPAYAEPAAYNFGGYDGFLQKLAAGGINPIVEIRGNPAWAATTLCGPVDKKPEAFTRFLQAIARRYGQPPYNVKHWELYNEPDNAELRWGSYLGGCWGSQAAEYVAMLQAASSAIKSVSPEAKIVLGGLAHEGIPTNFNINFLDQILAAGAGSYLDVVNIHYFSSQHPTWQSNGYDIAGKVGAARKTMAIRSVSKPVMVTEMSWTSSPKDAPDLSEKQAQYVPKVFARGRAIDLYAMTWFTLSDWDGADYPYGLTDKGGQPKPAYLAYRVAAAEFRNAEFSGRLRLEQVSGTSAVEGYVYRVAGEERWVLWAEESQVQITIPAGAAETHDKLGAAIPLSTAGSTSMSLSNSPIYVHFK